MLFTACTWGLTWPQSKFLLTMLPPFSMRTVCGVAGSLFAFALAAAWLFGLGTAVAKKHPLRMPPAASVAWQGCIGTIPVLVLAQWEHPVWGGVTHGGWASIAYISSLPLSVAYLACFRALKLVPASTAATTVLVSPMVGVIGSTLLLGEALGPRQLIALAMTLTGVALAARG